jgi:hypothetical protein
VSHGVCLLDMHIKCALLRSLLVISNAVWWHAPCWSVIKFLFPLLIFEFFMFTNVDVALMCCLCR